MSPESKVCSIHTSCSDLRTKYTSEAQVQTSLEHCANLEEYDKILLEMTALPKDDSFTDEITENITEDLPTESARQVASMRFVTLQVFQIKWGASSRWSFRPNSARGNQYSARVTLTQSCGLCHQVRLK